MSTSELNIDPSLQLVPAPKDPTAAERPPLWDWPQTERDGAMLLCAQQDQIEIGFNDRGDALITQKSWPDEDVTIVVARENIGSFIDHLTDALGIPAMGGVR